MLGVLYLLEIKDWDLIKNHSKKGKLALVYSEYHLKTCHFAFPFTAKNVSGLLNFTIILQDGSGNKMSFPSNEIKVLTLSFKIHIVKLRVSTLTSFEGKDILLPDPSCKMIVKFNKPDTFFVVNGKAK